MSTESDNDSLSDNSDISIDSDTSFYSVDDTILEEVLQDIPMTDSAVKRPISPASQTAYMDLKDKKRFLSFKSIYAV